MPTGDISNLGLEADLPEELQRISAETEHQALLQHFGLNVNTLNSDIWQAADREAIVNTIATNISTAIAGTRHALGHGQLVALLNPQVQAAAERVASSANMASPERRRDVANVLAQAVYDALPKEILHVVIEQEIANPTPSGRAAYTPAEQDAARKFYEKLRQDNDSNDMVAGMAMLVAMRDATSNPTEVAAVIGPPPVARRPSWEQKYVVNNTETVRRKNVAETVAHFKTIQPIVLPSKVPLASTCTEIITARTDITTALAQLNSEIGTWETLELAYNSAKPTYERDIAAWEHVEKEWSDHRLATQAAIASHGTSPPPPATPRYPRPVLSTPQPVFTAVVLPGVFRESIRTVDKAREKVAELEAADVALQSALAEFLRRSRMIEAFVTTLQGMGIANFAATFPHLNALCTPGTGTPPGAPTFDPALFTANYDFAGLAAEIERNMPGGLKSVEEYSKEVVESGGKKMNGMDLSKAVLKAQVKTARPSLSNADVDAVVEYIVNRTKVDGILRTSVEESIGDYLGTNDEPTRLERWTHARHWSNWWYGGNRESLSRPRDTINEIARGLNIGLEDGRPNWRNVSYEKLVASYFSIKELMDGKGPADLQMTAKPEIAVEELQTISRLLTTKYAGTMEKKVLASLSDDEKKAALRSRAHLGKAVQDFLTGDTPAWAQTSVKKAHERADKNVAWMTRGAYNITAGGLQKAWNVGSWMTGKAWENVPSTATAKTWGTEAAKIAGWSLLGGPAIGLAAYLAMNHFSPAKEEAK